MCLCISKSRFFLGFTEEKEVGKSTFGVVGIETVRQILYTISVKLCFRMTHIHEGPEAG